MIEILPDLWICKNKQTQHIDSNVVIINCMKYLTFLGKFKNYKEEIKKNILKYEIVQMFKFVVSTIENIHCMLEENKTVIVSCNNALQFSPLVIIAYLIKYGRMTKDESIKLFLTKKSDIYEDDLFFHNILNQIEKK
jgi:protein-tyrosine phosphatase